MADITKVCPHCGVELKISEYVDLSAMACPSCGNSLDSPAKVEAEQVVTPKASQLRFKQTAAPAGAVVMDNADALKKVEKSLVNDKISIILGPDRWKTLAPIMPWLTFVILLYGLGLVVQLRADSIVRWLLGAN